ncbi:MAG: hypothetical protein WBL68_17335 [Nitrososphaeraceae archaeon]
MEKSIAMPTESKKCQYCGSNKAGIATNEERTKYLRWNRNPYEKGAWLCGKCYRNYPCLEAPPLTYFRKSKLREE